MLFVAEHPDARIVTGAIRPDAVLMLYGLGGADRLPIAEAHRKRGGTYVAFDLGYWDRGSKGRKFRVSVNGFHSPDLVMHTRSDSSRWHESGLQTTQAGNPNGPILLIGNAPKSNAVGAAGWTQAKAREIREKFPGRKLLYRPKPRRPVEPGVLCDGHSADPIEVALANASLVVCRHSNVAVDACRMGVPVVCDDGAAAAIYPQRLEDADQQPSVRTRREFLHRLAWWQWSTEEVREPLFWEWLGELLEIHRSVSACGD